MTSVPFREAVALKASDHGRMDSRYPLGWLGFKALVNEDRCNHTGTGILMFGEIPTPPRSLFASLTGTSCTVSLDQITEGPQ